MASGRNEGGFFPPGGEHVFEPLGPIYVGLNGGDPGKCLHFDNKMLLNSTRRSHSQNVLWLGKLLPCSGN